MNPKRKKDWFKPLVTSTYDGSGLHIEFGYEGNILCLSFMIQIIAAALLDTCT